MIDLLMISVIGIIVEVIAMYLSVVLIPMFPRYIVSLLIITVAIARWNWFGAVLIPVMALCDIIIGKYVFPAGMNHYYQWIMLTQALIAFCSPLLTLIWRNKAKGSKIFKDFQSIFLYVVVTYLLTVLIFGATQSMIFKVNMLSSIMEALIYSLISGIVFLIFMHILNLQNVMVNVKKLLFERKYEKEHEEEYYSAYNDASKRLDKDDSKETPNESIKVIEEEKKGV